MYSSKSAVSDRKAPVEILPSWSAWVPLPLFLLSVLVLMFVDFEAVFEPWYLIATLNLVFSTGVSLMICRYRCTKLSQLPVRPRLAAWVWYADFWIGQCAGRHIVGCRSIQCGDYDLQLWDYDDCGTASGKRAVGSDATWWPDHLAHVTSAYPQLRSDRPGAYRFEHCHGPGVLASFF